MAVQRQSEAMRRKLSDAQHRALAVWAADCAEHVLPCFERAYPGDERPRAAIEACRGWARTGTYRMADVRRDSLGAHAAARAASDDAARFAARAAGHAVATAHVASHAIGPALYGALAADAAGVAGEREWQFERLPVGLRPFILRLALERPSIGRRLRYPPETLA